MDDLSIKLISASAGSGKTYSLAEELLQAIKDGILPEGIVATTFTNKAAIELMQRVRLRLLFDQRWEEAQRILDGYVGTVNSVCGRILKDFALEAGLSPVMDVLPEGEDKTAFDLAMSPVVLKYSTDLERVSSRCGIEDWRKNVKEITDLARTNAITAEKLKECAESSWETLGRLLPKAFPEKDEGPMDRALWEAIDQAARELATNGDDTKKTGSVKDYLRDIQNRFKGAASLPWSEWVKLEKLDPAVKSRAIVEPVKAEASKHARHPRFHRDLATFIRLLFSCAAEALVAFADYKKVHGIIDFVDQEALAFELLKKPKARERLSEDLAILFVDEFQDTSPIQLALFVELSKIVGRAVWVGDQKQAIFGFRGTDPMLMDSVMEGLISEKSLKILSDSYRSRPGLVEFTSELFSKAFRPAGIPEGKVRLKAKRLEEDGLAVALQLWRLDSKNADQDVRAITAGIRETLAHAAEYRVFDRDADGWRPLRVGDIAVLCRTNDKCEKIAATLESSGIRAAIPRTGLLKRPECILSVAALRYLVDENDSLAAAEVVHLSEGPDGAGRWFDEWMKNPDTKPWKTHPLIASLDSKRERMMHLTPAESLDFGMNAVSADRRVLSWSDAKIRLSNLERLRGFASEYEERCLSQRTAASAAGLITYLKDLEKEGADAQSEGRDDRSVQVLTYHRAKGLEWPFVILADLQAGGRANAFGVRPCSPQQGFDPRNPLEGRSIRFWPWPYAGQKRIDWLDEALPKTREQEQAVLSERKELMRLLYVGMTRARDYMAISVRDSGKNSTAWLDQLADEQGRPLLELPLEPGIQEVFVGTRGFPVMVSSFKPLEEAGTMDQAQIYTADPALIVTASYPPAVLFPSKAMAGTEREYSVVSRHQLGDRIDIGSSQEMDVVGEAIHRFLAADRYESPPHERAVLASRLLTNWQVKDIEAESLVIMSDRIKAFVDSQVGPECRWCREWPVRLKVGHQKAKGWVDLLLESTDGFTVIDHKSFPGRFDQWESKALEYGPQLTLYREAIEKATGKPVLKMMVHMPVLGMVFEIGAQDRTGQ